MTEWICVLNKLFFGSAAYPDFVCLRRDTFLQKIKNDYLAKKCVCVAGGGCLAIFIIEGIEIKIPYHKNCFTASTFFFRKPLQFFLNTFISPFGGR